MRGIKMNKKHLEKFDGILSYICILLIIWVVPIMPIIGGAFDDNITGNIGLSIICALGFILAIYGTILFYKVFIKGN